MSTRSPLYNSQNINFLLHGKTKRALSFTAQQPPGLTSGTPGYLRQGAGKEKIAHSVGRLIAQVPPNLETGLEGTSPQLSTASLQLDQKDTFTTLQTKKNNYTEMDSFSEKIMQFLYNDLDTT